MTDLGRRLKATYRVKELNITTQVKDEFAENDFSPALYDLSLVLEMLKQTIAEKRTNEKFVILEGLCNSGKFVDENDKLELRFMDEFNSIEKQIGEVCSVIDLRFNRELHYVDEKDIIYENPDDLPKQEVKQAKPAEDEEGAEEAAAKQAPKFNLRDYTWTKSNRQAKNLP